MADDAVIIALVSKEKFPSAEFKREFSEIGYYSAIKARQCGRKIKGLQPKFPVKPLREIPAWAAGIVVTVAEMFPVEQIILLGLLARILRFGGQC